MRSTTRSQISFLTAGFLLVLADASAVTTIGHGRLLGSAAVRADYDSNIFVSNSEVSDTVGTFSGAVRYVRNASEVSLDTAVSLDAYAFADHNNLNSADPALTAALGYNPSDKTDLRANFDWRRSSMANEAVNDRTESNNFVFSSSAEQLFSEKLGLRANAGYNKNSNLTQGYSDVLNYSLGLDGVYVYSPKLKLLAGFTTVESWTTDRPKGRRSPSNMDQRYTVGAEGELAPKVTGELSVGVVQREFDGAGFNRSNALYLSSRLSWAATEKTTWTLLADQNLSLSAADQSVKAFSASLGVSQALSEKLSVDGSIGFDHSNYSAFGGVGNRTDDGYIIRARFNYVIKDNVTVDASAGYRDNRSTLAFSTYDRINFGAGITIKF